MINLVPPLGLGDAIIVLGAVVYLSESEPVRFPCLRKNEANVKSFFINHPNVTVYPIDHEDEMLGIRGMPFGWYKKDRPPKGDESFDEWFYRELGVPYEARWSHCPIRKAAENVEQFKSHGSNYVFVHEDASRGYQINRLYGALSYLDWLIPTEPGVLRYVDMIENAKEVHVIPSCFKELTSSLKPKGKLFLHAYARPLKVPFDMTRSPYHWEILD